MPAPTIAPGSIPAPTPMAAAPMAAAPMAAAPMSDSAFDPAKLADIHLPEVISFWPIAPGWWILLVLFILSILLIIFFKKMRAGKTSRTGKKLKSQAMRELMMIHEAYKTQGTPQEAVKQLSIFLRRYALSLYQRDNVASLTDTEWLNFLDQMPEQQSHSRPFSQKFSELLTTVPYQPAHKPIDTQLLSELFKISKVLVESHTRVDVQDNVSLGSAHV